MESTSTNSSRGRSYKAFAGSLPVRLAMVPLVGFGVARSADNGLLGLGIAVAMVFAMLIGVQLKDQRRRRREAREHIAGLSRW
jgi:hypothetical protein